MLDQQSRLKRILIVDDEPTLVFFLKQGLQEAENYIVEGASSGEDALTKLTYNRYDLIVTDLKMPGISGFTLVEVARSLHSDIGVILITAFGSPEVQNEVEQLNVDGYLTKPFPIVELQGLIKKTLAKTHKNSEDLITKHNL